MQTDHADARAAELDTLADDLDALTHYADPWPDSRPGPAMTGSDTDMTGYATVAAYARLRAAWLRTLP